MTLVAELFVLLVSSRLGSTRLVSPFHHAACTVPVVAFPWGAAAPSSSAPTVWTSTSMASPASFASFTSSSSSFATVAGSGTISSRGKATPRAHLTGTTSERKEDSRLSSATVAAISSYWTLICRPGGEAVSPSAAPLSSSGRATTGMVELAQCGAHSDTRAMSASRKSSAEREMENRVSALGAVEVTSDARVCTLVRGRETSAARVFRLCWCCLAGWSCWLVGKAAPAPTRSPWSSPFNVITMASSPPTWSA
mmetsp:Transcript_4313/g.13090  ORF Transcript_4313/g.13090 Transcript_4313/m.13090 type:complete len:253 (+) Transcript_4313:132-890(+)